MSTDEEYHELMDIYEDFHVNLFKKCSEADGKCTWMLMYRYALTHFSHERFLIFARYAEFFDKLRQMET